jgi:hypothetical protein
MKTLYTGPAPLAQMVRDELQQRGIGADLQGVDPFGSLAGSAAAPPRIQAVLVTPKVAQQHAAEIEAVLALVTEAPAPPEDERD